MSPDQEKLQLISNQSDLDFSCKSEIFKTNFLSDIPRGSIYLVEGLLIICGLMVLVH